MLMIFGQDDWWNIATPEEIAASVEAHNAFSAYLQSRGGEVSGEGLHPSKVATTIRPASSGDGFVVTDGPFVELKETLGGFYVIEAADIDEAIEVAKKCPAEFGIEIRPVIDFSE
jgi:hypothetical protein